MIHHIHTIRTRDIQYKQALNKYAQTSKSVRSTQQPLSRSSSAMLFQIMEPKLRIARSQSAKSFTSVVSSSPRRLKRRYNSITKLCILCAHESWLRLGNNVSRDRLKMIRVTWQSREVASVCLTEVLSCNRMSYLLQTYLVKWMLNLSIE